jgi:peptidyl-prolyl cis-trans isomerase SurA
MRSPRSILGTGLAVLVVLAFPGAGAQTLDRIVAVVQNDPILESELKAQVQFHIMNNRLDPATPGIQDQVLQSMINEKLIVAKAIIDSVEVSDEEVQQQMDRVIQQRIQQVGSEQKLEEYYGMPLSKIKREYRDELRKNLLAQRLQQQRFGATQISRREVQEFFASYRDSLPRVAEEVELAHIFVRPRASDRVRTEAVNRIAALRDSILAGADFGSIAKAYSQDVGSAQQNGDLGWVRRGQFVKEFETAAFSLSEKQLSGPVETEFGIHLIQLLERRGDAVHARHILLRFGRSDEADTVAVRLLDSLRTAVLNGASFAELAKKNSEDKESAMIGGSYGTVELEQLDKAWYATVADLKVGEISRPERLPVGSGYGYHIVLVKKRTPAHTMTLDNDYYRIEAIALNFKRQRDFQVWMEDLRTKIYWTVRP